MRIAAYCPASPATIATGGLAIGAMAFGLLTIVEGGHVLFDSTDPARASAVPFVLWFNFLAGFAYVAAGLGLLRRQTWAVWLSVAIAAGTLLVFGAFGLHVLTGGAYAERTPVALTLRSVVWVAIAIVGWRMAGAWKARSA